MKISLMLMLIATVVLAVPVHPQAESRTPGYVTSGQMHVTISRWRQVLAIHRMVEVSNESLSFGRNYHRPFIADWLPCLGHKAKGLRINRV